MADHLSTIQTKLIITLSYNVVKLYFDVISSRKKIVVNLLPQDFKGPILVDCFLCMSSCSVPEKASAVTGLQQVVCQWTRGLFASMLLKKLDFRWTMLKRSCKAYKRKWRLQSINIDKHTSFKLGIDERH